MQAIFIEWVMSPVGISWGENHFGQSIEQTLIISQAITIAAGLEIDSR